MYLIMSLIRWISAKLKKKHSQNNRGEAPLIFWYMDLIILYIWQLIPYFANLKNNISVDSLESFLMIYKAAIYFLTTRNISINQCV
jgi:lipid-A-disaccharide synthase-like uncharacterized protein